MDVYSGSAPATRTGFPVADVQKTLAAPATKRCVAVFAERLNALLAYFPQTLEFDKLCEMRNKAGRIAARVMLRQYRTSTAVVATMLQSTRRFTRWHNGSAAGMAAGVVLVFGPACAAIGSSEANTAAKGARDETLRLQVLQLGCEQPGDLTLTPPNRMPESLKARPLMKKVGLKRARKENYRKIKQPIDV